MPVSLSGGIFANGCKKCSGTCVCGKTSRNKKQIQLQPTQQTTQPTQQTTQPTQQDIQPTPTQYTTPTPQTLVTVQDNNGVIVMPAANTPAVINNQQKFDWSKYLSENKWWLVLVVAVAYVAFMDEE